MRKTIIPKINHKLQANAIGVCEENKNETWLKYFAVKGSILDACKRTVTLPIKANFTTEVLHSIKIIVQKVLSNNVCARLALAVVMETSA